MRSPDFLQQVIQLRPTENISVELRERLFLRVFGGIGLIICIGLLFSGTLVNPQPAIRIAQIACLVLLVVSWALHARLRTYLSLSLLIWGFWALVTALILSEGGNTSMWMVPQFLLVVFTRFVLTSRTAIFLGLLTAAVDLGFYQLGLVRLVPAQMADIALENDGLAITSSLFFVLLIFHVADLVLRETLRENQLSQGRYRSLFENITDAVLLLDKDYRFLEINHQASELFGTPGENLVGRVILDVLSAEEARSMRANFERLEQVGLLDPFERSITRSDGSIRMVETSLTLVRDEKSAPRLYQIVIRDITDRKRLEDDLRISLGEMESLAMQDPLTGLLNRRAIMEHAEAEWHRSRQDRKPMCIMLVDLDNFKSVNDTVGHLEGDKVIRQAASVIQSCLRRSDWAGRWGGDEFLLILPGTSLGDAKNVAERLRNKYISAEAQNRVAATLEPYLSIGISVFSARPGDETSLNQLFAQADAALYQAKEQGKNRVEIFRETR